MTERKIYYIDGKRYWRMEQTNALQPKDSNYGNNDVCTGCVFPLYTHPPVPTAQLPEAPL